MTNLFTKSKSNEKTPNLPHNVRALDCAIINPFNFKFEMKQSIYKFTFNVDSLILSMPKGAKILSVQVQRGNPCIWAICDIEAEKEDRRFDIYGTGTPFNVGGKELNFIGTFQLHEGSFVGHLFEVL